MQTSNNYNDKYIPMEHWSKDHWSTLAYVETVIVDCAGFQIGSDARMRSNRRHFRLMNNECPRPKRSGKPGLGITMGPEHGTCLKDNIVVPEHDDWMCVQDMAAEGLFTISAEDIEPSVVLNLSPKGTALVEALRRHKSSGGTFSNFAPTIVA
jgi:hypothetical protein